MTTTARRSNITRSSQLRSIITVPRTLSYVALDLLVITPHLTNSPIRGKMKFETFPIFTPLKVVTLVILSSIGKSSLRQRKALSQNAHEPAIIDRAIYSQRHALTPAINSDHSTSRKDTHKSKNAKAAEAVYLNIFFGVSFIIGDKFIQNFLNFVNSTVKRIIMASILGIGNALTDILAVLPDDNLLKEFHLPKGSMQHVDMETGDKIWKTLKPMGVQLVAGGSAANTITGTAIFGMESGFIGKVGDDDLGHLFKSDQAQYGIRSTLLKGVHSSGRAMVFITAPNAERTFAVYLGAALELVPEDLKPEYFEGYDYFHIEGYLVQNQATIRRAVELAKAAGCIISIDMASYNVVESNDAFLHDIVENYVDIVFANESEAKAFTKLEPREALDEIASKCKIAVVKVGKDGSMVKSGNEYHFIESWPAKPIDATGAGDTYAAGFLYAHSLGMPLKVCGEVGSIIAAKVVEVVGTKIDIPRWKSAKQAIRSLIAANTPISE